MPDQTASSPGIRTVAVVGAGAVGGYYGARLASVAEVSFLMRGDFEAVRREGLHIESVDGDFHLHPARAYARTEEIGPVDLVVVALKTTANERLPQLAPPLLKPGTVLLTLQNGLGNEAFLQKCFPGHPVLGGMCFVCINRIGPGRLRHLAHGRVEMGALTPGAPLDEVAALFASAGLEVRVLPDLGLARWRKLVWNVPFNGLSIAAGSKDTAEILADEALSARVLRLMEEIIAVAGALGHRIDPEFARANLEGTREMGPYRPSSLIDFDQGAPVEVESIWGEALRAARELGVTTPELSALYEEIRLALAARVR